MSKKRIPSSPKNFLNSSFSVLVNKLFIEFMLKKCTSNGTRTHTQIMAGVLDQWLYHFVYRGINMINKKIGCLTGTTNKTSIHFFYTEKTIINVGIISVIT